MSTFPASPPPRPSHRPSHRPSPRSSDEPSQASPSGPAHAVDLLVKDGCHLCADAVAVVDEVCGRLGVPWRQVDIAEHPDLAERHAEEIPVLMVDGIQRDFWRIDPDRLERLLAAGRP